MPKSCKMTGLDRPVTEYPLYWFVLMERAVETGDLDAALRARQELRRLGVQVVYGRPPRTDERGGDHAA